jgi:8-amino-7-oxononanoate synthase
MKEFRQELESRIDGLRRENLLRSPRRIESPQSPRVVVDGREYLNFSSNDYLGLAAHPNLREAAIRAMERHGAGAGASRLICGTMTPHLELEQAIASFKETEAALSFSSGYAAAFGAIGALMGRGDVVVIDKLVHACVVDAARLSGAKLRIFDHNDMPGLEKILRWAREPEAGDPAPARRRVLVVTESVFSMDGDMAPLAEIVRLKDEHGAWLMLDEAHATGLYGERGAGLAQYLGLGGRVEIQMGTLSKAIGASGGYICGIKPLVELLVNRARTFIFTTAPMPAAAAAARAGIELIRGPEGTARRTALWCRVGEFASAMELGKWPSAIIPVIIGDESRAMDAAAALREKGIFIPAVRYPTVARGEARLRVTLSAAHTSEELDRAIRALREIL